ncbi:MAG: winged helix-turn-helix transcriptional regulator, partial [bacterium]|nr:winged helix-turn-helix transcriptional regulator [Candidatus Colisoma equi]
MYKALKDDILSGKYTSGKLLPSENALTRRFKVCRSTVQQAFRELEKIGLISRSRGRGTFVTNQGTSRKIGLIVPGVACTDFFQPIVSE